MKKTIVIALVFLMVSPALASPEASLMINSVEPSSVEPGESFTVQATISNSGDSSGDFKPLVADLPAGFEVIDRPEDSLMELCSRCEHQETFQIRPTEEVRSGSYEITLKPDPGYDEGIGQEKSFQIRVDGTPNVIVEGDWPSLEPESEGLGNVTLRNIGTETAHETTVSIEGQNLLFSPGTWEIGTLEPGESVEKEVKLFVSSAQQGDLQEIKYVTSYLDDGINMDQRDTGKVRVLENAELTLSNIHTEDNVIGTSSDITVELENVGTGQAEKIETVLTCEGADVTEGENFVGSLDAEESFPAVFTIEPVKEDISCDIEVSYEDNSMTTTSTSFETTAKEADYSLPLAGGLAALIITGIIYFRFMRDETE